MCAPASAAAAIYRGQKRLHASGHNIDKRKALVDRYEKGDLFCNYLRGSPPFLKSYSNYIASGAFLDKINWHLIDSDWIWMWMQSVQAPSIGSQDNPLCLTWWFLLVPAQMRRAELLKAKKNCSRIFFMLEMSYRLNKKLFAEILIRIEFECECIQAGPPL